MKKQLRRNADSEHQYFTVQQLESMIANHVDYWADPNGKSDIEAEAANVLNRNCLSIAKQLLALLNLSKTPVAAETGVIAHS